MHFVVHFGYRLQYGCRTVVICTSVRRASIRQRFACQSSVRQSAYHKAVRYMG